MNYENLEYLLFTVKQTKKSIYDVGIDMTNREFRIEMTDLYGHVEGSPIEGVLRKSSIHKFLSHLEEMSFLSWKQRDKGVLPIDLGSATVMYNLSGEIYYTVGNKESDLRTLHQEIEKLLGTTFGSYEFYR